MTLFSCALPLLLRPSCLFFPCLHVKFSAAAQAEAAEEAAAAAAAAAAALAEEGLEEEDEEPDKAAKFVRPHVAVEGGERGGGPRQEQKWQREGEEKRVRKEH